MSEMGQTVAAHGNEVKALAPATHCCWTRRKPTPRWPGYSVLCAHHRNQDALRYAITGHEKGIETLTAPAADIDSAISRRIDALIASRQQTIPSSTRVGPT